MNKEEKECKDFIGTAFMTHGTAKENSVWLQDADRLLDAFRGRWFNSTSGGDRFVVNTFFSLVNLMLPSFIFSKAEIRVAPKQAKYYKKLVDGEYQQINNIRAARIRNAAINNLYKKSDLYEEDRKAVQDTFFYGIGICKNGYSFDTIASGDKDFVVKDSPYRSRVNPRDFGWHPLATEPNNSPKLVHRIVTTREKLKQNSDLKGISDIASDIPEYMKKKFMNKKHCWKDLVTLYEVHDQERNKILTFAGDEHKLIKKIDNPYSFDGSHFSFLKYSGDNDDFLGIPMLSTIEDLAIALNEITTLVISHYRKFPGQIFANEGAIDEDQIDRIVNSEQGSINIVRDISQMQFMSPLSMGSEYFNIVSLLQNLIDRILGVPDFQRLTSSTRRSASEASFIQGDISVRRKFFLEKTRDFIIDGVEKLASIQAEFQDSKEEVTLTGDLSFETIEYDKEDLKGNYQFDIDIEELGVIPATDFQNLNNMLNVLASHPSLQPMLSSIDPNKLAKRLFNDLNIKIESIQKGEIADIVYIDPNKENEIARSGDPMPNPKKGEDHEKHIEIHADDLRKNGENDQIIEHIAEHILLQQQDAGTASPAGLQGLTQGPQGPGQTVTPGEEINPEGGSATQLQ